jgi:hypothetical protein
MPKDLEDTLYAFIINPDNNPRKSKKLKPDAQVLKLNPEDDKDDDGEQPNSPVPHQHGPANGNKPHNAQPAQNADNQPVNPNQPEGNNNAANQDQPHPANVPPVAPPPPPFDFSQPIVTNQERFEDEQMQTIAEEEGVKTDNNIAPPRAKLRRTLPHPPPPPIPPEGDGSEDGDQPQPQPQLDPQQQLRRTMFSNTLKINKAYNEYQAALKDAADNGKAPPKMPDILTTPEAREIVKLYAAPPPPKAKQDPTAGSNNPFYQETPTSKTKTYSDTANNTDGDVGKLDELGDEPPLDRPLNNIETEMKEAFEKVSKADWTKPGKD